MSDRHLQAAADLDLVDDPSLDAIPLFQDEEPSPIAARFNTTRPSPDLAAFAVPAAQVRHFAAPAADPTDGERRRTSVDGVDWVRVKQLRDEISAKPQMEQVEIRQATEADRVVGRRIIHDHVQETIRRDMKSASRTVLDLAAQAAIEQALEDAIFGLGRLEALLAPEAVENIEVHGFDGVLMEDNEGNLVEGQPVADSDDDLLDTLKKIASREGKPFSESVPWMHLQLPGHARLAAVAWVTPRPVVVIRRHRVVHSTLDGLVERGTIDPTMASLLAAAVRAGRSIVIAGAQGAGKTTLMRALCNELDPMEPIATFQDVEELFLAEMPGRSRVMAAESRPGSGEYTPDGRRAGEITLRQLIEQFFRFNRSRLIVGEVRGSEILGMIDAALSSTGSLSTTHARDAYGAIDKLITCGMQAGAQVTEQYMTRALGSCLDLVVFLHLDTHGRGAYGPGKRDRYVTQILEVGRAAEGELDFSDVYLPGPNGRGVPHTMSDPLRHELKQFGFDADSYDAQATQHDKEPRR